MIIKLLCFESTERKPFRIESFDYCTILKLLKNQHLKHHGSRAIISCKRFMSKSLKTTCLNGRQEYRVFFYTVPT